MVRIFAVECLEAVLCEMSSGWSWRAVQNAENDQERAHTPRLGPHRVTRIIRGTFASLRQDSSLSSCSAATTSNPKER